VHREEEEEEEEEEEILALDSLKRSARVPSI
jgi:hypothetical protein